MKKTYYILMVTLSPFTTTTLLAAGKEPLGSCFFSTFSSIWKISFSNSSPKISSSTLFSFLVITTSPDGPAMMLVGAALLFGGVSACLGCEELDPANMEPTSFKACLELLIYSAHMLTDFQPICCWSCKGDIPTSAAHVAVVLQVEIIIQIAKCIIYDI